MRTGVVTPAEARAFGTLAKAASVGAKTVSFCLPDSAPARPADLTSFTSVLNWPAPTAVWTMFLLGAFATALSGNADSTAAATSRVRMRFT